MTQPQQPPTDLSLTHQFFTSVEETRLRAYGDRAEMREMVYRLIKSRHPANALGINALISVAQIALATGAKPLHGLGELYVWQEYTGALCWQLGYRWWERRAIEQGGVSWMHPPARMHDDQREAFGVAADAPAAAYAAGYATTAFYHSMRELGDQLPVDDIRQLHVRVGIGIIDQSETYNQKKKRPIAPPKGKTWQWVANKRAARSPPRPLPRQHCHRHRCNPHRRQRHLHARRRTPTAARRRPRRAASGD